MWQPWKSDFPPLQGLFLLFVVGYCCLLVLWLLQTILVKSVLFVMWSLCSINLGVTWYFDRVSFNGKRKGKKRRKYSPSLGRLVLCWSTPSMLSHAAYNSALAFTHSLHRAWRPLRGKSLESSQAFFEHVPTPDTMYTWFPGIHGSL